MGVVQGGVTASILDAATGCAIQTFLEAGVRFATIDLNVKYIKPVQVGGYPSCVKSNWYGRRDIKR